jgi:hypothetical protein
MTEERVAGPCLTTARRTRLVPAGLSLLDRESRGPAPSAWLWT